MQSPSGFFAALRMTLLYGEPCYSHNENPMADKNQLYYGDNLDVLRRYVRDGSVDLVYLDPPFNSRQDYNVLFAEKDGSRSSIRATPATTRSSKPREAGAQRRRTWIYRWSWERTRNNQGISYSAMGQTSFPR